MARMKDKSPFLNETEIVLKRNNGNFKNQNKNQNKIFNFSNDSNDEDEENQEKENRDNLKEVGNTEIPKIDDDIYVLNIIGQIEGHSILSSDSKTTKYEHIIPMLAAIQRDKKVKGVLILLNTVGGDLEAGLAISEMINSISKPTVSLVIGGGHSIGVPLATASNYSFISPSATMIVHPIRMNGLVIGAPQTYQYFNKMQDRITDFVVRTSKISTEELKNLIFKPDDLLNDTGTLLIGEDAVKVGLIDEVGGIDKAIKKLEEMIK